MLRRIPRPAPLHPTPPHLTNAKQEVLICCSGNQEPPTALTRNYPRIQSKLKLALLYALFLSAGVLSYPKNPFCRPLSTHASRSTPQGFMFQQHNFLDFGIHSSSGCRGNGEEERKLLARSGNHLSIRRDESTSFVTQLLQRKFHPTKWYSAQLAVTIVGKKLLERRHRSEDEARKIAELWKRGNCDCETFPLHLPSVVAIAIVTSIYFSLLFLT